MKDLRIVLRNASLVMPLERKPRFCANVRRSAVDTSFNAFEFVRSCFLAPKSAPAPRRASDVADGLYGSYGHYFATDANDYLFASGIQMENVRVIRMQGSDSVLPFQAYLRISDVSVDELQLTEDEALVTGITTVRQAVAPVEWYTVNGLRLQGQPKAKGLYISNGQQKLVR